MTKLAVMASTAVMRYSRTWPTCKAKRERFSSHLVLNQGPVSRLWKPCECLTCLVGLLSPHRSCMTDDRKACVLTIGHQVGVTALWNMGPRISAGIRYHEPTKMRHLLEAFSFTAPGLMLFCRPSQAHLFTSSSSLPKHTFL